MLGSAAAVDSPVAVVELRNLGNDAPTRDGAMTAVPAPFLLHAVGLATDGSSRSRTEDGLSHVRAAVMAADIGRSAASFADGRATVAAGLDQSGLQRLAPSRLLAP